MKHLRFPRIRNFQHYGAGSRGDNMSGVGLMYNKPMRRSHLRGDLLSFKFVNNTSTKCVFIGISKELSTALWRDVIMLKV